MTEYWGTIDVVDSYKTKAEAQRELQELKRYHPDIKGWRIVAGARVISARHVYAITERARQRAPRLHKHV